VTSPANASEACCIWCGDRLADASDAASFLFLARREGQFVISPEHWQDASEHLEGHQFFCHAACFQQSVPEKMQSLLRFALYDE
jgi:hypothetical protein